MFKRLRQKVFENLGIKITSLILALAVYAHVYSQQDHLAVLHLPVTVEGVPSGLTYRGELPSAVPVRFRAKGGDLFKLRTQPPRMAVNLAQVRPGPLQRPLTVGDVVVSPEVDAKAEALIEPAVLSLFIEPVEKAGLPVTVVLRGTPAHGMISLGLAAVWPESVGVTGPASVVSKLTSIPTEEVDLDGRSETVRETVRLRLPNGVKARVERVSIRVPLVPLARRDFGPLAVALPPGLRGAWRVQPDSVHLRLSGPQVLLEAMTSNSLHPRAVPALPYAADEAVPVELSLPPALRDRVTIEAIDPENVVLVKGRRSG